MLSACITPMQAIKGASIAKAISKPNIADNLLDRNEKQLCTWPTIGSLERKYGKNPTKYKEYHKFCDHRVIIND